VLITVMIPNITVKLRSASMPLDFITNTIAAIATDMNIQNINIVDAIRNPTFFLLINAIPVSINAGKQIAMSST